MLPSKQKIPNALRKQSEDTKRTTIILEKNEREFIDLLLKKGKETGIKPLISKMLDIYKNMMIHDWRYPGEYYCGISRIALVNVELLNILTQEVTKEKWYDIGLKMGDVLRVSIQSTVGIETSHRENWEAVFERLKIQGFGDCYLKDKFLLIKTPFINESEIWRGILERLLTVELVTRNPVPPFVFQIENKTT
jgi:hypothetical protein